VACPDQEKISALADPNGSEGLKHSGAADRVGLTFSARKLCVAVRSGTYLHRHIRPTEDEPRIGFTLEDVAKIRVTM
jgi:hypothetical protein